MAIQPAQLALLTHHRWTLPALAALYELDGACRVAQLCHILDAHRDSVTQAIDTLVELRLLEANPGHGHPLRPEYLLTSGGAAMAPHTHTLQAYIRKARLHDIAMRKWSLPSVLAIHTGASRFGDVRHRLGRVTDRAMSQSLQLLTSARLIGSAADPDDARSVHYCLRAEGQRAAELLSSLPIIDEPRLAG